MLLISCSRNGSRSQSEIAAYDSGSYASIAGRETGGPGYDEWESPAGIEGQTAPVYGEMSISYDAQAGDERTSQDAGAMEKGRKLIKSAEIRMRVDNLDEAKKAIEKMLEQYRAYSSNTLVRDNSINYTLKIPVSFYGTVFNNVSEMGKVLHSSENVEDTTIKFYDLESRLGTKEALLITFRSYLGQAKNIDEIMSVEKRIAELQQEIDWFGAQLSNLSYLVEYATIDLQIQGPAADSVYYKPGIKERIGELLNSFGEYLSTVVVILTGIVVYGIPSLFIIVILFWLLFGKIGLLKKLWYFVSAEKANHKKME
jgi:hypothetical protein